jgi:phosphomannomutase/phosphoglucomutase
MNSIFREYDIRGIAQDTKEQKCELNNSLVKKIAYYFTKELFKKKSFIDKSFNDISKLNISLAYDARSSCNRILLALISGINQAGANAFNIGLAPTPVSYFSAFYDNNLGKKIDATMMITGSHNPKEYNGIKMTMLKKPFFADDIYALEKTINSSNINIKDNHNLIELDMKSLYIDYMVKEFKHLKKDLEQTNKQVISFVFDCANGASGVVMGDICKKIGLSYKGLYENPDGNFPNHHPDPSDEKNLIDIKNELKNGNFDYGFAYDGDGDRIAFLTKKYNIKGDILALLFAQNAKAPFRVVGEVKCSVLMYDGINSMKDKKAIMYKTGHSNLKTKLQQNNFELASEVSGHIFFNDIYFGYDDAIYASFRVLRLICDMTKKSGDINCVDNFINNLPKIYNTDELKINVKENYKFEIMSDIKKLLEYEVKNNNDIVDIISIDGVRINYKNGWALIRASNTTPYLITRFESVEEKNLKIYQKNIKDVFDKALKKYV